MRAVRSFMQRILLATDGTVTTILEEYAGEKICVVLLDQSRQPCPAEEAELLGVPAGFQVLDRKVLLRGERSGETFLFGDSLIVLERLHDNVTKGLVTSDTPIGKLIRENRMETFREILRRGEEPAGPLGPHFEIEADATLSFRTYRIMAHKMPLVLITEKLPALD